MNIKLSSLICLIYKKNPLSQCWPSPKIITIDIVTIITLFIEYMLRFCDHLKNV